MREIDKATRGLRQELVTLSLQVSCDIMWLVVSSRATSHRLEILLQPRPQPGRVLYASASARFACLVRVDEMNTKEISNSPRCWRRQVSTKLANLNLELLEYNPTVSALLTRPLSSIV